ncbi:MAG TPA: bifunctional molybdenum cofactor biosynthesis protein MoaC/MoaB [Elusimicrobiota bacterium]|nr:bifunctional molybdenum cofactor biosynthesis protein MoaC/MoaB [Elusimicrobiota bacterium]
MADVGAKRETARKAAAIGSLSMSRRAFALLKAGELPKGDALAAAELAGVMAAKITPQLLPLCHPLPLDVVTVEFTLDSALPGVHVRCEAHTTAKTGVEMEALTGASVALLCVYDLVKPVDPVLEISGVRLEFKSGGKKGYWIHPKAKTARLGKSLKLAKGERLGVGSVITVSDRVSKNIAVDKSGPLLADGLREMGFQVAKPLVVPDETFRIASAIRRAAAKSRVVVLTGGTGLSPRDVTPEAVSSVCSRLIPGFGETLRSSGPVTAPLSRSLAGQLGECVVVALPGSPGGVRDGLAVLRDLLPHAVHIARGGDH